MGWDGELLRFWVEKVGLGLGLGFKSKWVLDLKSWVKVREMCLGHLGLA